LKASPQGSFTETNVLANVTILGIQGSPSAVQLNEQSVGPLFSFSAESQTLSITGLDEFTQNGAWSQDWTLTWS
jgi:alpha-glucosidase